MFYTRRRDTRFLSFNGELVGLDSPLCRLGGNWNDVERFLKKKYNYQGGVLSLILLSAHTRVKREMQEAAIFTLLFSSCLQPTNLN